jgi:hypothetical protein
MAIRKKKIDYTPWLIGLGAAGAIGYLFRKEIKNLIMPGSDEPEPEITPTPVVIENIVTPGGNVAVKSEITKGLSPLGTPKANLNMDQILKFGDKGQEIAKMQQILNRISKITGKAKVTEDGIWGNGTQARLSQMFGNTTNLNLYKLYVALWAIWAADKGKNLKNWFNTYQTFLQSAALRGAARETYFKNNTVI